jgi:hypothetical protein
VGTFSVSGTNGRHPRVSQAFAIAVRVTLAQAEAYATEKACLILDDQLLQLFLVLGLLQAFFHDFAFWRR